MAQQQRDAALEAFDGLRLRKVRAEDDDTASTFLARFQSTAASLKPDERIKLEVCTREGMELLKVVLIDPQTSKVCALNWGYDGEEDVNSIVSLLINNCPELASLQVDFGYYFAFDFVSSVLEHPSNKIKVLEMPLNSIGDLPRFFAALGQSQVSALALFNHGSSEVYQGLCDYLAKDLLVRLEVDRHVPCGMMISLAHCTCLAELEMLRCEFFQPTVFADLPKSITKLALHECAFYGNLDWSFLAGSNVRKLDLSSLLGMNGNHFGAALIVHLKEKGLDELRFCDCYFVSEALAVVGVEIRRVKKLGISDTYVSGASIELIALTLQSPDSQMKELRLPYLWSTRSSIEDLVVPALKHPNCSLTKLSLSTYLTELGVAAKTLEDNFRSRCGLFALLQGQQVRRKVPCQLRRLPVEMFRLVGEVLV